MRIVCCFMILILMLTTSVYGKAANYDRIDPESIILAGSSGRIISGTWIGDSNQNGMIAIEMDQSSEVSLAIIQREKTTVYSIAALSKPLLSLSQFLETSYDIKDHMLDGKPSLYIQADRHITNIEIQKDSCDNWIVNRCSWEDWNIDSSLAYEYSNSDQCLSISWGGWPRIHWPIALERIMVEGFDIQDIHMICESAFEQLREIQERKTKNETTDLEKISSVDYGYYIEWSEEQANNCNKNGDE